MKAWNICALMKEYAILIPALQRNYVHGRDDEHAKEVREHFVDSVLARLQDKGTMHLDLVYGVEENGVLVPIDGQQRLTTLWLMAIYCASHCPDNVLSMHDRMELLNDLSRFSYEARPIAATFCHWLTSGCTFGVSELDWAEREWGDDPTVRAMIMTLRTIIGKVENNVDLDQVKDVVLSRVTFDFRPVLGDATDLYVKVNARGKTLTQWENLKGKFADSLKKCDVGIKRQFEERIERLTESYFEWAKKNNAPDLLPDSSFFALFGRVIDYWVRVNKKGCNRRKNLALLASARMPAVLPYVPVEEFGLEETGANIVEPLCRLMEWSLGPENRGVVVNYWDEVSPRSVAQMVFTPVNENERDFVCVLFEYFRQYDLGAERLSNESHLALRLIANVLKNVSREAENKHPNGAAQFNRVEGLQKFIKASPRLYSKSIVLEGNVPHQYREEIAKAKIYEAHPELIADLQSLEVSMHGRCRLAVLDLVNLGACDLEKTAKRLKTLNVLFADWQDPGERLDLARRVIQSEPLKPSDAIKICYNKFPDDRLREWLATRDDAYLQRVLVDGEAPKSFDKAKEPWRRDWRDTVCGIMNKADGFQYDAEQAWCFNYDNWEIRRHKPSECYYLYYGGNLHNALPVSDWRYELYRKNCWNEFCNMCDKCKDKNVKNILMNDGDTHSFCVHKHGAYADNVYFCAGRIELRRYQKKGDRAVLVQEEEPILYTEGMTAFKMLQKLNDLLKSEKWRTA